MRLHFKQALVTTVFILVVPLRSSAVKQPPISIEVDATDISRKLIHSEIAIPVRPGPLTLEYPKWIPGYHAPIGPLNNMIGLKVSGQTGTITWQRDPVDMFAFHLTVPEGTSTLQVSMDIIAPTPPEFSFGSASAHLFVLEWNNVLLYPAGVDVGRLPVRAKLRLPKGWRYACIAPTSVVDEAVELPTLSLRKLVDSPLLAGQYFKQVQVSDGPAPVFIDMVADDPASLDITPLWIRRFHRLVVESEALFGRVPYRQYRFLLALSDEVGDDGVEHREGSDNRVHSKMFADDSIRLSYGYLFPHEYTHAWNGKYRYPKGLATRDFQQPQTDELLWVYEGLTRYLNWVLGARSGFFSPQEAHDYAAIIAAGVAYRSGRDWRSLQDTAVAAPLLYFASSNWESMRRSLDYYDESLLLWLEADTIIRRHTDGKRSLDDFCRTFFGPQNAHSGTYGFKDVVTALNSIAEYDWVKFFKTRLSATGIGRVPLDGLVASGWDLVYGKEIGSVEAARDKVHQMADERFSWGLIAKDDGTVIDIIRPSAAYKAGLGPGMKIDAINGGAWSLQRLRETIADDPQSATRLVIRNGSAPFEVIIDDRGGARYPRLVRNTAPDLLSEILKPRVPQQ